MSRQTEIASSLGRVVLMMRDRPEAREDQKSAFRALLARLAQGGLWIGASDSHVYVDGEPITTDSPELIGLRDQMLAHGIGEMRSPRELSPSNLLLVVRALAADRGTFPRLQQLADYFGGHGLANIQLAPPVPLVLPDAAQAGPAPPVPVVPPTARGTAEGRLSALGPGAASEDEVGLLHFARIEKQSAGRYDDIVAALEQDPGGARAPEQLNELVAFSDQAAQKEQWEDVLRTAVELIRLEDLGADETSRRAFSIALRRSVGSRGVLEQVARMTFSATTRDQAMLVLKRIGADATEILLRRLIAAKDVGERRGYFNALAQMTEGTDVLANMLDHDEWFVVRNVADLCGEMKLERAVPALIRQSRNSQEKVRRAVAGALARIGTPQTVEPLRTLLGDSSPAVRLQVVSTIDERFKNLVPALVKLLDGEDHATSSRRPSAPWGGSEPPRHWPP